MQHFSKSVALVGAIVLGLIGPRYIRAAESLTTALQAIQQVGPQAAGAARATQAWRTVAESSVDQLPQILDAFAGVGPLAANYLRSAVDAIAERTLASGGTLPRASLEQYVVDRSHDPRARRVAYEWLLRADSTATRLVPTFIDDPSLELRRDAVAELTAQAEKLLQQGDQESARRDEVLPLLTRAFSAARDLDQIAELDKLLGKLNARPDLPRHFGFITTWRVIGSFDNRQGIGFDAVYPPELKLDYDAKVAGKNGEVAWLEHTTADRHGKVEFNKVLGKEMGCVAYAAADFYSNGEQEVELRLGCICASKLWLNGQLLGAWEVYHSGTSIDQYRVRAKLRPGKNVILVKVLQNEQTEQWAQDWDFQLRVCDMIGTAVPSATNSGENKNAAK